MRGRLPSGPKYVEQLSGSEQAKERLQVILETMAGTCRVRQACTRLGISEPRFHQLRLQVLEAALQSLEPRAIGRPPRSASFTPEQVAQLQEQLTQRDIELRAAQLRTEIALVLPQVVQEHMAQEEKQQEQNEQDVQGNQQPTENNEPSEPDSVDDDPEKKTPQRRSRRSRRSSLPSNLRPPGKRKNT